MYEFDIGVSSCIRLNRKGSTPSRFYTEVSRKSCTGKFTSLPVVRVHLASTPSSYMLQFISLTTWAKCSSVQVRYMQNWRWLPLFLVHRQRPRFIWEASVCKLAEFLDTDPEVPGSISGATTFSEKQWVWKGVHSSSWVYNWGATWMGK
jgi:hypothetical protein